MEFIANFPFFSIILCLFSAVICSILRGRGAKICTIAAESILAILSFATLWYVHLLQKPVTFMMGHFPAPWGNEIRFGTLEAVMATVFSLILLCSVLGGSKFVNRDIFPQKINLYYVLINLLGAALMALIYTNDIFTGYVFLEILTLTSGGILMIREIGRTTLAATRYMILNLLGSGLFLLGIILMYDITGHLLMVNMHAALKVLVAHGSYSLPLTVIVGVMCVGLAIKSGLFPFHSWMPDTYGFATPTSASILSGLVSKGYIFLLVKIMYRVIGIDQEILSVARNILFVFGLCGIVFGSVFALQQNNINRMTAYSSVAQIGYIYMGIGIGGTAGFAAAMFHILAHAITKPALFLANASLMEVSGDSPVFHDLSGAAHRNKAAGVFFTVGAMSMVGIPFFAGFTSKLLFSVASLGHNPAKTGLVLVILAISTILNTLYFIRTVIRIYTKRKGDVPHKFNIREELPGWIAGISLAAMNLFLGLNSRPVIELIEKGLLRFQ
ncbi:MAG: sodium:proton antiporter [Clostridia bacterium]|nr:sodium:proton antiporter [Clostridia bacterium]